MLFNIFCSAVRWAVPIFLMLSGSLFLGRDIPIKKVYSKYIFRLVCAFVSWNIIYLFLSKDTIQHGIMYRILDQPSDLIKGHYHMWFLIMIIGMYMGMPIYRKIVSDKK
ncbi:acyltransferase family protein [Butyrivibrio sp. JL13D10]|uniref:acyltransferase family protein n=1 Tax=Butyrivibrio sp. JL13D10 TaxID=3236815 RepID=UPI0038B4A000